MVNEAHQNCNRIITVLNRICIRSFRCVLLLDVWSVWNSICLYRTSNFYEAQVNKVWQIIQLMKRASFVVVLIEHSSLISRGQQSWRKRRRQSWYWRDITTLFVEYEKKRRNVMMMRHGRIICKRSDDASRSQLDKWLFSSVLRSLFVDKEKGICMFTRHKRRKLKMKKRWASMTTR